MTTNGLNEESGICGGKCACFDFELGAMGSHLQLIGSNQTRSFVSLVGLKIPFSKNSSAFWITDTRIRRFCAQGRRHPQITQITPIRQKAVGRRQQQQKAVVRKQKQQQLGSSVRARD